MVTIAAQLKQLENKLDKADSSAIKKIVPRLAKRWISNSWLAHNNPYRAKVSSQIKGFDNSTNASKHTYLSEYIAASVFGHSFDGWSYLGRALEAEMAGDPDIARHLGYYAELRAAMSFLASQGIGVFSNEHIVVTGEKHCSVIKNVKGTHEFVWNALSILAKKHSGIDAVLLTIKPGGVPLLDWINQFSRGGNSVATQWLQQWGFDLSEMIKDKNARNLASYRPTAFTTPGPRPIGNTMEGILQLWEVCEPSADGGFPVLDRYLLRNCLKQIFPRSSGTKKTYENQRDFTLGQIDHTGKFDMWREFLAYEELPNIHGIIQAANGTKEATHPDHSKQVLARATLLLRIATGCAETLLREAGPNYKDNLNFWWSSPSVRRRLWAESDRPDSFIDLWSDIEEASIEIREWLKQNGHQACRYDLWTDQPAATATLTTTERAYLWGIGF